MYSSIFSGKFKCDHQITCLTSTPNHQKLLTPSPEYPFPTPQSGEMKKSRALIYWISSFHIIVEEVKQNATSRKSPLLPPSLQHTPVWAINTGLAPKILPLRT